MIFTDYAMPRVLERIGMRRDEIVITDDALDVIMDSYQAVSGIRDLEQIAEHMAANALYRIETEGLTQVIYDAETVRRLLET